MKYGTASIIHLICSAGLLVVAVLSLDSETTASAVVYAFASGAIFMIAAFEWGQQFIEDLKSAFKLDRPKPKENHE